MRIDGALLFVIPVYFRSPKANRKAAEAKERSLRAELNSNLSRVPVACRDPVREHGEQCIRDLAFPWRYTQIVGFIHISYIDDSLKAFY
jgi:hypothetical protein